LLWMFMVDINYWPEKSFFSFVSGFFFLSALYYTAFIVFKDDIINSQNKLLYVYAPVIFYLSFFVYYLISGNINAVPEYIGSTYKTPIRIWHIKIGEALAMIAGCTVALKNFSKYEVNEAILPA
jgi:hypothetical protein